MNEEELKAGDVVYLKSGSQAMTIKFIEDDEATCNWHLKGESKEGTYPTIMLTRKDPARAKYDKDLKAAFG